MSTRATIRLKEKDNVVNLYHHHDGYPKGVGAVLKDRLNNDNSYWDMYSFATNLIKDRKYDEYELTFGQHGDEEYAYLVDFDTKTITCYDIGWDERDWKNIVFQESFDKYKRAYLGVTWDKSDLLSCKIAFKILYLYKNTPLEELETLDFGNLDLDSVIQEIEENRKIQDEFEESEYEEGEE